MLEEALPPEAVKVRDLGPNEVWETENWQYLVRPGVDKYGHRKVLNVVRK